MNLVQLVLARQVKLKELDKATLKMRHSTILIHISLAIRYHTVRRSKSWS